MPERRADGALEQDILRVLWAQNGKTLTPGDVNELLEGSLAYTTVMTVLTRLWQKGLVERVRQGRAYAYRPTLSESDLVSRRMNAVLAGATDRASVLSHFVGSLSKRDVRELRRLLEGPGSAS